MSSERLYYDDPFLLSFEARVVERRTVEGQPALVLDRTAFYPTSGGQPHDRGTIEGVAVLDVIEEGEEIVHVLADEVLAEEVTGRVDAERRFDHMQQHTGQHILSQAFVEEKNAETVSFHLSERYCTIDLDRPDISQADLVRVEERANAIVFADLPVGTRFAAAAELASLPLRKPPGDFERIRIVEVEGFDWSACGGTHCLRSGQVGLIRVTQAEHRGAETRVTFHCGWRALRDARWKHELLSEMARPLSVGIHDLPETVARLSAAEEASRKALERVQQELLQYEAQALYEEAEAVGPARVVRTVFPERSLDEVRLLAREIAARPGGVALLGQGRETGRLCFARAEGLPWHMGQLVRQAAEIIGGRGGGRPEEAQAGGPETEKLEDALRWALETLRAQTP